LKEALDNNYWLFFEHDKETMCCNLQPTEKGIRKQQQGTINDWLQSKD